MAFPIQNRFPRTEFDYQVLLDALRDYERPRDKISKLMRQGVILRVKKGLYVLGDAYRQGPVSKELLANLIYGPSCLSLEWALAWHGLIPERVEAFTSVTTGRSRRFATPLGLFTYTHSPPAPFWMGFTRGQTGGGTSFLVATAERALCDKVRADRGISLRSLKDMTTYLLSNLRIDPADLAALDEKALTAIASRCSSAKVRLLAACAGRFRAPFCSPIRGNATGSHRRTRCAKGQEGGGALRA